jgi:hypothetical protein
MADKPYRVLLASCGNPDYGQDPDAPQSPEEWRAVADLEEASRACRAYVEYLNLGGGNWSGGLVVDAKGKAVARVSYNGRVWPPEG